MSPWEVLGLTREQSTDEAAVKAAYARLLKQHRPDRDPEGFQRVRAAYDALRRPNTGLSASIETVPIAPTNPASKHRAQPLRASAPLSVPSSSEWDHARERLRAAMGADMPDDEACLIAARELVACEEPDGHATVREVACVFQDRPEFIAALIEKESLVNAWGAGERSAFEAVWEQICENEDWEAIRDVCERVLMKVSGGDDAFVPLALELGRQLLLHEPKLARRLIETAESELSEAKSLEEFDHFLLVGKELESWPEDMRHEFATALINGEQPVDTTFLPRLEPHLKGIDPNGALAHFANARLPGVFHVVTASGQGISGGGFGFPIRAVIIIAVIVAINFARCSAAHGATNPSERSDMRPIIPQAIT